MEFPGWVWSLNMARRTVGGEGGSETSRNSGGHLDRELSCCWVQGGPGPTCGPWLFGSGTTPETTNQSSNNPMKQQIICECITNESSLLSFGFTLCLHS